MMLRSATRRGWIVVAVAVAATVGPAPAAGQSEVCREGRLSRIKIQNNSLFAPDDIGERRLSWALSVVNSVHMRTRVDYLRGQVLLEEGGCYEAEALAASVRNIRELSFIARAEVDSHQGADSTWVVQLETWDEWSTQAGVYFDVESEFQFQGFYVTETNALGRGLRVSFRNRKFRERNDRNVTLASTRFLGSRARASIAAGVTRTGSFFKQEYIYPFISETGRLQVQSNLRYEDREQSYFTGNDEGISNVLFPFADRSVSLRAQRRFGVPGDLTLVGGEMEVLRRTVSGPAQQVMREDFETTTTASDSLAALLQPQAMPDSYVRLGATIGLRRIRFTDARGLDLLSGVQDVALGTELALTVGRTFGTWGTSVADTYGWLDGFASGQLGPLLANVNLRAGGRYLDSSESGVSRWRDMRLSGRGLFYVRPPASTAQVFVTGVRFNARGNIDQPYQVVLGGEEGVRGYRDDELPTGSTMVGFVEERVALPWFRPAVDIGLTVFADYGRGWAHDIPFGQDTGWRAAVGGGIRLGFPSGTGSVTHIEVAWPIGGPAGGRGPVLRTYWSPVETKR
jgi:hypothetical protein